MNLDLFQISESASLKDALKKIELNHNGVILAINDKKQIVGLATDGDIRRCLINNLSLSAPLHLCINRDFIWAESDVTREFLMKKLDHNIRYIPLLNSNKELTGLASKNWLPPQDEQPVYARSRAPVRVSFGGGGSDLTHYFVNQNGAVINSTLAIYSHATLRLRSDTKIIINSKDLGEIFEAVNIEEAMRHKGKFDLIIALLKVANPNFGFEMYLDSDFPMNSGLGGSAVVSAAVLGCFNQLRQDKWDSHELAELAYQAERLHMGVAGGWQDQYASVFGGFNFMEFRMEQNIVHPLRIPEDTLLELEENLVLCNSNLSHHSGEIHKHQKEMMTQDEVIEKVKENVELTYEMRNNLLRGRLHQFGLNLNKAWSLKKQFSSRISSQELDNIYDQALLNGALGGKLLGAGGGGFFLFYVPAFKKLELIKALEKMGKQAIQFRFESEGLKSWTVREEKY
ncbi:GHMP family kinase ATP-binding protein [Algibacillus agarilyticus]|uniref:GHMP family kinase ATP-binding protein n=1 Tax=Algibacillus agarilyticus TaxID=2234133 RepID=UPI000DCFAA3F|nr:CBS domain-containing protein [Algibacillus agarilyticus]